MSEIDPSIAANSPLFPKDFNPAQQIYGDAIPASVEEPLSQDEPAAGWREVWRLGKSDFRNASGSTKFAVGATALLYGYEVGPGGNEVAAPFVLGQVAEHFHNAFPGSVIAGAATGAFIGAEQFLGGKLTIKSVKSFPAMSKSMYGILAAKNSKKKPEEQQERVFESFTDLPVSKRVAYAVAGGTGFNIAREAFAVGETDTDKLKRVNRTSAFITASAVALIAGGVDAADKSTDNAVVNTIAGGIKNPLVLMTFLSLLVGGDYLRSRRSRNRISNEN